MALSKRDLRVGMVFQSVVVEDLKRTQIVQYAGASGDFNPLHSDERFATEVAKNPSIFAHGMLTMGLTAKALTDVVDPDHVVSYGGRFVAQVWPGDTLTATWSVTEMRDLGGEPVCDLEVETRNEDGVTVFKGWATARLDP